MKHPVPRVISFTGSTPVGRHIGELAGNAVKKVCLELGGNTPFVVLEDADLNRAVDAAIAGQFLHQGQICMAINRIIVDARCHDDFVARFIERAKGLKAGDPGDGLRRREGVGARALRGGEWAVEEFTTDHWVSVQFVARKYPF